MATIKKKEFQVKQAGRPSSSHSVPYGDVVYESDVNDYDGADWNTGIYDADVFSEWVSPEIAANNAATRERNEWLEKEQYNLPVNEMARQRAAGVNPNLAAQGIVGAAGYTPSSTAEQAQPQNPFAPAAAVADVASGISTLGQLPAQVENLNAAADLAKSQKNEVDTLLSARHGLIRAQRSLALEQAGLSKSQSRAFDIENEYRGESMLLDLEAKRLQLPILRQNFKNLQKQYDVMNKEIDKIDQEILESGSRISLNDAQRLKTLRESKFIEANTFYQNGINKIMELGNFDPRWPSHSIMLGMAASDLDDEQIQSNIEAVCNALYNISLNEAAGKINTEWEMREGLIKAQEDADVRKHAKTKGIDYGYKFGTGSGFSVNVGPFGASNVMP